MGKIRSIVLAACAIACMVSCGRDVDYLVLVNKTHALPGYWEEAVRTVHTENSLGDDVETERRAYEAYIGLKEALAGEGVHIDLDSGRRTIAQQQDIVERFTLKYGADYVAKYVAVPGYSEHHTGLALDLYLVVDGRDVYLNEDMVRYPDIWARIHAELPRHGFILRYPQGKEDVTGYAYEPWHIRYVGSAEVAQDIQSRGLSLEEYLAEPSPQTKME